MLRVVLAWIPFEDDKKDFSIYIRDPKAGDVISGTGGIRKTRLRSSSRGKSGGFCICYLDYEAKEVLYLILIYAKNEKDNINKEEKKILKELVATLKGTGK